MIPKTDTVPRKLVPRWRSLSATLGSSELASPMRNRATDVGRIPIDLAKKLVMWRRDENVVTAGELVESCLVEGQYLEGVGAAKYLLQPESSAAISLKKIASVVLARAGYLTLSPEISAADHRLQKALWRRRTREYPDNALAWLELAYLDTITGRRESAYKSIQIALRLAPHNRHVLRSAARYFVHIHQPDRAYQLVAKNAATRFDPWLISAEISLADLSGKKPKLYLQGKQLIDSGDFYPRQLTEVAGAIGTLEMDGGKRKKAKEYFLKSLIDPNGNVLAQTEWETAKHGLQFGVGQKLADTFDAAEARAIHFIREKNLDVVVEACKKWSRAEPYSLRPWELGGIYASLSGDFDSGLELANEGMVIRGSVDTLINTKAFCLASLGKLDKASEALASVSDTDGHQYFVSEANRGLIQMRLGNLEPGLTHYRVAIEGFRKTQQTEAYISAQIYMYREAARAGIKDVAPQLAQLRAYVHKHGFTQYLSIIDEADSFIKFQNLIMGNIGPIVKASFEVFNWPHKGGNTPMLLK